jgi:hypothetical protein
MNLLCFPPRSRPEDVIPGAVADLLEVPSMPASIDRGSNLPLVASKRVSIWLHAAGLGVVLSLFVALPVMSAPTASRAARATAAKRVKHHPFMVPKTGLRAAHAKAKTGITPAKAFTPIAGTTLAANSSPALSLSSPTVNVIFAGPNWSDPDKQTVLGAVQAILASPYLSSLNQPNYGSDGKAVFGTSSSDSRTITLDIGFAGGALPSQGSLDAFMSKVPTANNPNTINVAFYDTTLSNGAVGDNVPTANGGEIYVGTRVANDGSGRIDRDAVSALFSHELAEAMTSAVAVTDPGGFNLGTQICDNEPEVRGYYDNVTGTYTDASGKQVTGTYLVQAYWSQRDGAWVVPPLTSPARKPAVRPGTRPAARTKR